MAINAALILEAVLSASVRPHCKLFLLTTGCCYKCKKNCSLYKS